MFGLWRSTPKSVNRHCTGFYFLPGGSVINLSSFSGLGRNWVIFPCWPFSLLVFWLVFFIWLFHCLFKIFQISSSFTLQKRFLRNCVQLTEINTPSHQWRFLFPFNSWNHRILYYHLSAFCWIIKRTGYCVFILSWGIAHIRIIVGDNSHGFTRV